MISQSVKSLFAKFYKFAFFGVLVYLFDASCFKLLLQCVSPPSLARVLSLVMAMMLSWWLNRTFTFSAHRRTAIFPEMLAFMASQLPGACFNALASILAFKYLIFAQSNPWLSAAVGSCAGLVSNFCMAHFLVFRAHK